MNQESPQDTTMQTPIDDDTNPSTPSEAALIAEYSSLRSSIDGRIALRGKLLIVSNTLTAGTIALFAKDLIPSGVLLLNPILSAALAAEWIHTDLRIHLMARYLRQESEPQLLGTGWYHYLDAKDPPRRNFAVACVVFIGQIVVTCAAFLWVFFRNNVSRALTVSMCVELLSVLLIGLVSLTVTGFLFWTTHSSEKHGKDDALGCQKDGVTAPTT
ncbi:MAG: hypothetical protein AAF989_00600 [Planctomycetota bacterium]